MRGVQKEIAAVEAQVAAVNKSMMQAAKSGAINGLNTDYLRQYAAQIKNLEKDFHSAVDAQGAFNRQSMKVTSHADKLTEMIQRQKFGLKDLITEHKNLNQVYRDQMALQKSMVMQWGRDSSGAVRGDLLTPRTIDAAGKGFREVARQAGFYNQVLSSVADQTVKWGKNTQWAGRQLMAGITMPIAAAAAGTGVLAYQLDKGLTQVTKVYGDAATAATTTDAEIKAATMSTAKTMAASFGQSAQDSIEITSQLASAGKVGTELQESAAEVTRARTLGELNLQDAMKATITLQSVYDMQSKELGETFNFMNQMENQTALTMQDFVVGIPKVSGVLKEFGGTVQDAGVLMAGMKAAGIDAAEGANAIKSISFKIIAPNEGSKDLFEQLTGSSFETTMEGADGVVERLIRMSQAMKGLEEEDRVGLVQKMFGLYQGSKTLSLLGQLTGQGEQMARAFEVAGSGAASWAETANRELSKLQASGWQQVKQQWESLKIQLAQVGDAFLKMAPPIMKFFTGIISGFNEMGEGKKRFLLIGAAVVALTGPLIMLAGLMGNLIGNVGKLTTFMTGLALRFKIQNSEQIMAEKLAHQAATGIMTEAQAMQHLSNEMTKVTKQLGLMNRMQMSGDIFQHPTTGTMLVRTSKGGTRPIGSKEKEREVNRAHGEALAMQKAGTHMDKIEQQAEKTNKAWAGIRGHAAQFASIGTAGLMMMGTESGSVMNNISNAALAASMIGPSIVKGLAKSGAIAKLRMAAVPWTAGIGAGAAGATSKMSGLLTAAKGLGPAFAAAGPPLLAVAATVGVVWYQVNKAMDDARAKAMSLTGSHKDYAEVLGYTWAEGAQKIDEAGNAVDTFETKVNKLKESNKTLADTFKDMRSASDSEKMAFAINEGAKARLHGATKEQAEEAAAIALKAMGSKLNQEQLTAKIRAEIDFGDARALVAQQGKELGRIMSDAFNGEVKTSMWESFGRLFTPKAGLNAESETMVTEQAKQMWQIWSAAEGTARNEAFNQAANESTKGLDAIFMSLQRSNGEALKKAGINTMQDLVAYFNKSKEDIANPMFDLTKLGINPEQSKQLEYHAEAAKLVLDAWAEMSNIDVPKDALTLDAVKPEFTKSYVDTAVAAKAYSEQLAAQTKAKTKLTEADKLATLNMYRLMSGNTAATHSSQGFTDVIDEQTDALTKNAAASRIAADFKDRFSNAELGAEEMLSGIKNYYSSAQQAVLDIANRQFDENMNAAMDKIGAEGDRRKKELDAKSEAGDKKFEQRQDALESKWDARMKAADKAAEARKEAVAAGYDKQIEKIEAAIKAEQDAEAMRQKIFAAEKTRIQRLAEAYNRSIDINMAINSGDLDAAAKLSNDAQAAQEGWLVEDAAGQTQSVSDKAVSGMEKQIENINKTKDARLKALDAQEEREKELLEAQKKRDLEALKSEQERYRKSMEVQKANLDLETKNKEVAERKKWELAKRSIDMQMAELIAQVPQSKEQLDKHIGLMDEGYSKWGVNLKGKSGQWSEEIRKTLVSKFNEAQAGIQSEANWKKMGAAAAAAFTEGSFGMSVSEFMDWISTGVVPAGASGKIAAAEKSLKSKERVSNGYLGGITKHKGGIIGARGGNSRAGFSGKNLSQSEVSMTALKGEAVLNRNATRNLGTDFVDAANKGLLPKNIGGPDLGMGGLAMGMMGGLARMAMQAAVNAAASRKFSADAMFGEYGATAGSAGKYGNTVLSGEQLRNAATIAGTAKSMGASNRDIVIALMTALQESSLRNLNHGDRDSLGLFQQRAAWGSAADRTNPAAATRMFLNGGKAGQRGLFDFPNRGKMTMAQAAQAVQVSAFPGLYGRWEDEALAILSSLSFTQNPMGALSPGGWLRPANGPRTSGFGMRWGRMHTGSDIGAGMGAPIRASKGGRVVFVGNRGGKGQHVQIDHGGGIQTGYSHMSRFNTAPGQMVQAGQTIGFVGNTGNSTGPHLHFEYVKNGKALNPNLIIPGLNTGGFTMSDGLAMLHKNETVLTAPLSQDLKEGIRSMDKSQHFGYDVTMNFDGAVFNGQIDFQKGVEEALDNVSKRLGPSRRIGGK